MCHFSKFWSCTKITDDKIIEIPMKSIVVENYSILFSYLFLCATVTLSNYHSSSSYLSFPLPPGNVTRHTCGGVLKTKGIHYLMPLLFSAFFAYIFTFSFIHWCHFRCDFCIVLFQVTLKNDNLKKKNI